MTSETKKLCQLTLSLCQHFNAWLGGCLTKYARFKVVLCSAPQVGRAGRSESKGRVMFAERHLI